MPTSLRGIANKARKDATYRFGNLYTMLTVTNLLYCWRYVNKKAVPGVDKVTAQEYEKNLSTHVTDLVERLKRKAYRAKFPNAADTPRAVLKHWDYLKPAKETAPISSAWTNGAKIEPLTAEQREEAARIRRESNPFKPATVEEGAR